MDRNINNYLQQRRAGVLLHPTSLPSGKLDLDAKQWLDFMQESGLSVWQMLPILIPDQTGSPYQSCSAFAIDPGLFSAKPDRTLKVDQFRQQQHYWLEDFALFHVLKQVFNNQPWMQWPEEYRHRDPQQLQLFKTEHQQLIDEIITEQCLLHQSWLKIKQQANERGIALFGDIPIFVALDSADVWANPQEFQLDESLNPTYVTGVPPDYFSESGQRWGNPHYNWQRMQKEQFSWWRMRFQRQFELFDIVRLDHFRGLEAVWMIEGDSETAIDGYWEQTPGDELLTVLKQQYPALPIVAEDLGVINDAVRELKKKFHLPGMSVLQFAFDYFQDNPHKPVNYTQETVVYTGTHDNDTTAGWAQGLNDDWRQLVFHTLAVEAAEDITGLLIDAALTSNANLAMFPLQDLLRLDSQARMNTPGSTENNWQWRFDWSMIPHHLKYQLRQQLHETGRLHE